VQISQLHRRALILDRPFKAKVLEALHHKEAAHHNEGSWATKNKGPAAQHAASSSLEAHDLAHPAPSEALAHPASSRPVQGDANPSAVTSSAVTSSGACTSVLHQEWGAGGVEEAGVGKGSLTSHSVTHGGTAAGGVCICMMM